MIIFFDGGIIGFFLVLSLIGAGSIVASISRFLSDYIWLTFPIIFIFIYLKNSVIFDISYYDKKYTKFNRLFYIVSMLVSFIKYFYMFIFMITFFNMLGDSKGIGSIVAVPLSAVGAILPMIVLSISEGLDMFLLSKFEDIDLYSITDKTRLLLIALGIIFMIIISYFCSFLIIKYTLNMMPNTYDSLFSNTIVNYFVEILIG